MQKFPQSMLAAALVLFAALALSSCLSCESCARKRAAREAAAMGYPAQLAPVAEPAAAPAAW